MPSYEQSVHRLSVYIREVMNAEHVGALGIKKSSKFGISLTPLSSVKSASE